MSTWTGLKCVRKNATVGFCEQGNELSGFLELGTFSPC
jgi:hypothetical protein